MAQSKNSFLSALASSVTSSGTVPSAALAPEVTSSIEGAGTAVYDSASLLPIAGNTAGDTAFVKSTSRLYIHSGVGWYNVAVINNTPTVQSITDSDNGTTPFTLATDGTPTTITITAQDSDGDPLTYNYSVDSGFAGLATLSQDANVFTITPYSEDSATTTSGTITFSVTDGINTATPAAQTFTLTFFSKYGFIDYTNTTALSTISIGSAFSSSLQTNRQFAVVGNYAYIGNYSSHTIYIYDISTRGTLTQVNSITSTQGAYRISTTIHYKHTDGNDYLVCNTDTGQSIAVWQITSNGTDLTYKGKCGPVGTANSCIDAGFESGKAVYAKNNITYFYEVDIPTIISTGTYSINQAFLNTDNDPNYGFGYNVDQFAISPDGNWIAAPDNSTTGQHRVNIYSFPGFVKQSQFFHTTVTGQTDDDASVQWMDNNTLFVIQQDTIDQGYVLDVTNKASPTVAGVLTGDGSASNPYFDYRRNNNTTMIYDAKYQNMYILNQSDPLGVINLSDLNNITSATSVGFTISNGFQFGIGFGNVFIGASSSIYPYI